MKNTFLRFALFCSLFIALAFFVFPHLGWSKVKMNPNFSLGNDEIVSAQLAKMSTEQKISEMFIVPAINLDDSIQRNGYVEMYRKGEVGGFVVYDCSSKSLTSFTKELKKVSSIPAFVALDAEYGLMQRVTDSQDFPVNLTLGASHSSILSGQVAELEALEAKKYGINLVLGPVAELLQENSEDLVNFRSFGSDFTQVNGHLSAVVKSFEDQGILSTLKHYPGYAGALSNPQLSKVKINFPSQKLYEINKTFQTGMNAKASLIMVGHAIYPALDSANLCSMSSKIVTGVLRKGMMYSGLIISDALDVPVITKNYNSGEAASNTFLAGCDLLLSPANLEQAKNALLKLIEARPELIEELNTRVKRILKAKNYTKIIKPALITQINPDFTKQVIFENAVTTLKNEGNLIPLTKLNKKIAYVSVGKGSGYATEMVLNMCIPDFYNYEDGGEALAKFSSRMEQYDIIITSIHATTSYPSKSYGLPSRWKEWLLMLPKEKTIGILFGNTFAIKDFTPTDLPNAFVCAYENRKYAQFAAIQAIFGSIEGVGKLPFSLNEYFPYGFGIQTKSTNRLKFTVPEDLGIASSKFAEIDRIALKGINLKAYPGCQVVVAVKGKVIYQKSFGSHTYDKKDTVKSTDLYDIASITKVAASTMGLMYLQSNNKFSLDAKLKDYLPETESKQKMGEINLRNMMTHQAGFASWVPFYKTTVSNSIPNDQIYSKKQSTDFPIEVAENLYMKYAYFDSIYEQIYRSDFRPSKGYEYSDLGYYFVKKIIEKQGSMPIDQFMYENIYKPMGLGHMRYTPLKYFPKSQCVPTEDDGYFRQQLLQGHVHDMGSAMLGGLGGHAGVFSSATDLCALMQMTLNRGTYGGVRYLNKEVVEEYIGCQFCPKSRRGVGFDRQTPTGKNGPMGELASPQTYGHTGFTGTCTWVDPVNEVVFVFLSNRVNPSANNWKIRSLNIRSEMQDAIYRAIK